MSIKQLAWPLNESRGPFHLYAHGPWLVCKVALLHPFFVDNNYECIILYNILYILTNYSTYALHYNNITRLVGCIPWDQVSHEHDSPLILEFYVYKDHLWHALWTFHQVVVNTTSFFEKRPSCSYLVILWSHHQNKIFLHHCLQIDYKHAQHTKVICFVICLHSLQCNSIIRMIYFIHKVLSPYFVYKTHKWTLR